MNDIFANFHSTHTCNCIRLTGINRKLQTKRSAATRTARYTGRRSPENLTHINKPIQWQTHKNLTKRATSFCLNRHPTPVHNPQQAACHRSQLGRKFDQSFSDLIRRHKRMSTGQVIKDSWILMMLVRSVWTRCACRTKTAGFRVKFIVDCCGYVTTILRPTCETC